MLDPIQGFIQYINQIKPFHTKILEIVIKYQYIDIVNIKIIENVLININFNISDNINSAIQEKYYFNVDKLIQNDRMNVYISDRTSNLGWNESSWSVNGWSLPVEPFMYIKQTLLENINIPITDNHTITSNFESNDVPVFIQDQITFKGASHPTLYLKDSVGVGVEETVGAVIEGGNLVGSWDYNYWDIGGQDENLNTLVNLYGQSFPP